MTTLPHHYGQILHLTPLINVMLAYHLELFANFLTLILIISLIGLGYSLFSQTRINKIHSKYLCIYRMLLYGFS